MTDTSVAAVLWDIDGTLLLTEKLHFQTIQTYCTSRDITLTPADNTPMLGKTMIEKWEYLTRAHGITDSLEVFRHACADAYKQGLPNCPIRQDTLTIMRRVGQLGIPQGCVSNGDCLVVDANIDHMGIGDILDFALCADDFTSGKPAADPYVEASKRLGLAPEQCLAVEDSPVGVTSAATAGMLVCVWPDPADIGPFTVDDLTSRFPLAHYPTTGFSNFPLHLLGLTLADLEA
jgi:beta-phosphoglucomutase-like phosphatase (HAD superfamily)